MADDRNNQLIIEALLFSAGNEVSIRQIMSVLGCDVKTARTAVNALIQRYERSDTALRILELDGTFQMTTKEIYYDHICRLLQEPKKLKLSTSIKETLSVVAYRQPATRNDIEYIRGVNCDYAITKLLDLGLIREAGRLDGPGHPATYETTEEFLRRFDMKSLDDLPSITKEEEEEITTMVEESLRPS